MQTVTLSFFRFNSFDKRVWVLSQMTANKLGMHHVPKAKFWKMFGSGTGEGFTPKPNWNVWSMLAVWPDEATARKEVAESPIYKKWTDLADECYTVVLTPTAARGKWDMKEPFEPTKPAAELRPIAALTRATVKFWKAERFWGREPAITHAIGKNTDVVFKIGVGETPFVQQVTFSVWPDTKTMEDFARGPGGPHSDAIKGAREEGWFKEELYARFQILGTIGKWEGKDPVGDALKAAKPVEAPKPAPAPAAAPAAPAFVAAKPAPAVEAPKPAPAPQAAKPAQQQNYNNKGKPGKPGGRKENA